MTNSTPTKKTSVMMRKLNKLKNQPKDFIIDSSGYRLAHRSWQHSLKLGSFLWVVVSFTIALIYFGLIASDRYVSRAEIVIKQADQIKMLPDTLSMLGIGGNNHQDVLLIQEYLKSPDLLAKLDKELSLKAHYQSHKIDFFSRLSDSASKEEFIEYYRNHLTIHLDDLSGVLTIELQSFNSEYSQRVVGVMLKESESFINKLGHQVAIEQLAFVEKEVDRAYQRVQDEKAKVLDFQNSHNLISPESTSAARLGVVSQIEGELASQQAQLKQLQSYMKATAPAVVSMQTKIDALTQQLAQEKDRLTGTDKDAMNEVTARYLDVKTQANLAVDLYKTGLVSLEQAKVEAYRKLKHLLIITQPTISEDAEYPRRLYNLATIGVLLCLFYGLIIMGLATLREHQD